jgi:membrane-associated protease RseP (regulator of RpoE activity)
MQSTIFSIIVLIFSVIIHEVSHGYAAYFQGDKTAKYAVGEIAIFDIKDAKKIIVQAG